ncbi:MAG: HEAT repeat domain-containing protein [Candidatus Lokiarchaeota archaeon]|nr:HEAT repeat domain-containing protein [Candidatus Lokiarchaeota archaeon]
MNKYDLNKLKSYILENNPHIFLNNLPKPLNQEKINFIIDFIITETSKEDYFKLGQDLISIWNQKSKKIGFSLIAVYWRENQESMKEYLIKLANDPDWGTREYAAKLWAVVLTENYENSYNWTKNLVQQGTNYTKRTIALAAKYSALERKHGREEKLLQLLEPLLSNKDKYIRKNLGPFALAAFLRAYPNLTIPKLKKWSRMDDKQIRWNVAKSFASSGGTTSWPLGNEILTQLATDKRRYVWKAVSSALHYLGRKKPNEIIPLLKQWLLDSNRKHVAEDALHYISKKKEKEKKKVKS